MIVARTPDGVAHQFPDGTSDDLIDKAIQGYIAENKQPEAPPSLLQAGLRGVGLGTRAVVEGAAALPGMALDAATWPFRVAQRSIGIKTTAPSDLVSRDLPDALGLPEPKTRAEQMTSAVVRGGAGAIPTMGVGAIPSVMRSFPTLANTLLGAPVSQVVGGGTGGGAGEGARQLEYSPWVQMTTAALGGVGGAAATQATQAAGRGVKAVVAPFTESGRQAITADVLLRGSSQPGTLPARLAEGADAPRLPGSPVTTAQQARDPGLLVTEQGMRSQTEGSGTATGMSPAARFRDVDARRNQVRQNDLADLGDASDPGARGSVVREALDTGETAMRGRVGQLYQEARPADGGAYPIERINRAAQQATAPFRPEVMGGGVPVELQAVVDDIAGAPGGTMTFDQIQNVRSRLGQIAGQASRDGNSRLAGAAGNIQAALEREADSPAWQEAIRARREMGTALGRDESGAAATGQITRTDRFGAPMLADEQVADRAIANIGNLRQTLGAVDKAVSDARLSGQSAERIAELEANAASTRQALQGQFIANLTRRSTTTGQLADASGNVSDALSPAGFRRFMDNNRAVADHLFSPEQQQRLQTLTADFGESSMAGATARPGGSPTAQNLSVANFISQATRGLVDPGHPAAQTLIGLGPVMKWVYAAPEAAIKEMLTEAMVNPRFASMLLDRASPESLRRAMGYAEQTMGQRLGGAATAATARQTLRSAADERNRDSIPTVYVRPPVAPNDLIPN